MAKGITLCVVAALLTASGAAASDRGENSTSAAGQRAASDLALVHEMAGEPDARRPLARLRSPLCLVVAANDKKFAETVATRIINNARKAGVPTRSTGCRANALVTFSDNARAQLQEARADDRKLFKRLSEREIDAVLSSRDPVYVFQSVEQTPRWEQGDASFTQGAGLEAWTKERSFLRTPEDLLTTMVAIENVAVSTLSATQIADYATLRLLAPTGEVDASEDRAPRTILSLFAAPETAPKEMTRFDRAYLRSLYSMPRTAFASEVLDTTLASLGK